MIDKEDSFIMNSIGMNVRRSAFHGEKVTVYKLYMALRAYFIGVKIFNGL